MRTVQMTLEPELVAAVDKAARRLGTTRSAFARDALRAALRRLHDTSLEQRQREGYRRRPVRRVLTRDSALEFLGEVTVAPVTSTVRDIPSEVVLTAAEGMSRDCAINLDHIQTVSRVKLGPVLTTLGPRRMSEVRSALIFALGV